MVPITINRVGENTCRTAPGVFFDPKSVSWVPIVVLQGVRRVQHPGIAGGPAGVVPQHCRGSRGRSLPELQGVWGAQSSGIAGGRLAARGPRGATTRNCRGFEGAAPPELQAIQGAQVPGIAGRMRSPLEKQRGLGGRQWDSSVCANLEVFIGFWRFL